MSDQATPHPQRNAPEGAASADTVSRRRFIADAAALGAAIGGAAALASMVGCSPGDDNTTTDDVRFANDEKILTSFAVVLMPAAGGGPSAADVGVAEAVWALSKNDAELRNLWAVGARWLRTLCRDRWDVETGNPAALGEAEQRALIRLCEGVDDQNVHQAWDADGTGYRFAQRFGRELQERYYAHPDVWKWLGYAGPPQPIGYPDADKPARPT